MHEESDGLDPVTGSAQGIVAMDSIRISGDEAMVVLLNPASGLRDLPRDRQ